MHKFGYIFFLFLFSTSNFSGKISLEGPLDNKFNNNKYSNNIDRNINDNDNNIKFSKHTVTRELLVIFRSFSVWVLISNGII